MKPKYLIALLLIISIFLSINMIAATDLELNNESDDLTYDGNSFDLDEISDPSFNSNVPVSDESHVLKSDSNNDTIEVWVDQNVSSNGNGSKESPFSNLQDGHDKVVNSSVKNAIININEGNYTIPFKNTPPFIPGPDFVFGDTNLIINGVGKVILDGSTQGVFFINPGTNVTVNNIIFKNLIGYMDFVGNINNNALTNSLINVNNCTFIFDDKYNGLARNPYDINYNNCIFINSKDQLFVKSTTPYGLCNFRNCIFSNTTFSNSSSFVKIAKISSADSKLSFNGIWLGINSIPTYTYHSYDHYETKDVFTYADGTNCLEKYALFTVFENYLGNNQYEIMGKLTWNGTDSSEGMENFPPMTVTLSSATGEIQNATLVNGTFKAIYTSESSEHEVAAKLDSEEINLTFANIALNLNAPIINYCENQNIVVNLSKQVTGIVTVTVNGIDYPINIDNSDSITVPIGETLNVGTHDVNVTFIDEENHIYGFNTTTITISTVKDYPFDVNAISNVKVGETKQLVITLPNDATGNVTVYLGTSNFTGIVNGNTTTINITGFVIGQNTITITYLGNDKYEPNTKNITVAAVQETKITAPNVSATYNVAKNLVITLKDANNQILANKTVTVKVGSITKTLTTNTKGQASLAISSLVPKTYTATISFAGDDQYVKSTATAKVVVAKAKPKLTAKKATFKVKTKTKKYSIILKDNKGKAIKKAKVTLKVKGKTYKTKTNVKGKATFKITKLTKKGTSKATIKFAGNKYFKSINKKVKIIVKK